VQDVSGGHVHQWKRLPVTDFTVTYQCSSGCGRLVRVVWGWVAGSVCEVDGLLTGREGGTVTGDVIEPEDPWGYCLAGRMSKVRDLGLTVPAEDLRPGADE
jgi:hypothetical protein